MEVRGENGEERGEGEEEGRGEEGMDGREGNEGEGTVNVYIYILILPLSQICLPLPLYRGNLEWIANDPCDALTVSSIGRPYAEGGCQRGKPEVWCEGWTDTKRGKVTCTKPF